MKKEILDLYYKNNIYTPEDLYNYMNDHFDYGASVILYNEEVLLPFGNEDQNAKDNKVVKFDDFKVSDLLYKYYSENINKINPSRSLLEQKQLFELTLNDIRDKHYKQNDISKLFSNKIAGCNEEMEFAATFLEKKGYEIKRLAFSSLKNDKITGTHWFVTYEDTDKKWVYMEHALRDFKGIHKFDTFDELKNNVISKMMYRKINDPRVSVDSRHFALNEIEKIEVNMNWGEILDHTSRGIRQDLVEAAKICNSENKLKMEVVSGRIKAYDKANKQIEADKEIIDPIEKAKNVISKLNENQLHIKYDIPKEPNINQSCPTYQKSKKR
jgi:hypothetical protein